MLSGRGDTALCAFCEVEPALEVTEELVDGVRQTQSEAVCGLRRARPWYARGSGAVGRIWGLGSVVWLGLLGVPKLMLSSLGASRSRSEPASLWVVLASRWGVPRLLA